MITVPISYPQNRSFYPYIFITCVKKTFLWIFQYWAGRVYKLCVYFMTGTPEGSNESDFGEARIEPATSEVSHMRRFKSFAARLCNKDYKFMSWVT